MQRSEAQQMVDLTSACVDKMSSSQAAAEVTIKEFAKMNTNELVREFVNIFGPAWDLTSEQTRIMSEWPREQVGLLHAVVVQAARLRMCNTPVHAVIRAVAGYPRSVSISLDEQGGLEITYVSPDAA